MLSAIVKSNKMGSWLTRPKQDRSHWTLSCRISTSSRHCFNRMFSSKWKRERILNSLNGHAEGHKNVPIIGWSLIFHNPIHLPERWYFFNRNEKEILQHTNKSNGLTYVSRQQSTPNDRSSYLTDQPWSTGENCREYWILIELDTRTECHRTECHHESLSTNKHGSTCHHRLSCTKLSHQFSTVFWHVIDSWCAIDDIKHDLRSWYRGTQIIRPKQEYKLSVR